MSSGPKASGGRNIVAYFAGHLANLVNGNDTLEPIQDFAEVKAFALYEKVRRTLATSPDYASRIKMHLDDCARRLDAVEAAIEAVADEMEKRQALSRFQLATRPLQTIERDIRDAEHGVKGR